MNRVEILEQASNLITGNRADSYGDFRDQMVSIADMFNALYGDHQYQGEGDEGAPFIEPRHVAVLLMLLKFRRMITAGDHDSVVDLCGYAALTGEKFIDPTKQTD